MSTQHKHKDTIIRLSYGASVIMKMQDARITPICASRISDDTHLTSLNTNYLKEILSTYSYASAVPVQSMKINALYRALLAEFQYDPMRFDAIHNMKVALPKTVISGRSVWNKVTNIYIQALQDYYTRLNSINNLYDNGDDDM